MSKERGLEIPILFAVVALLVAFFAFSFVSLGLVLFGTAGIIIGALVIGKVETPDIRTLLAVVALGCFVLPFAAPLVGYQIETAELPGVETEVPEGQGAYGDTYLTISKKRSPTTNDIGTSIAAAITIKIWAKNTDGSWAIIDTNSSSQNTVAMQFTLDKAYEGIIWVEVDSWTNTYIDAANTAAQSQILEWSFELIETSKTHLFKMFLAEEAGDEAERFTFTLYGVEQAQTVTDGDPADLNGIGTSENKTYLKWKLGMDAEGKGIAIKQIYVDFNNTDYDVTIESADMWYGSLTSFDTDLMASTMRYYIFDSIDPDDARWCVYAKAGANEYQLYVFTVSNMESSEVVTADLYVVYYEEGFLTQTSITDQVVMAA